MKLSVMLITYNHERFIAQALDSILSQRVNFDYEIVIGEDCSTDGTREILADFCIRYPNRIVPLLRDRNLGMMRNLEETLLACRGKYVALIEGDDYWTSVDKLQKQVDFLETHPECTVCCHRIRVLNETDSAQIQEKSDAAAADVLPPRRAGTYTIEDLLSDNFVMTCTSVYRKDAVGALPTWFLDLRLGDWPLHALAARNGSIFLMDEIMATYRVHSGGSWSSQTSMGRLSAITQMLRALDKHLGFKYHNIIRGTIAQFSLSMAGLARRDGKRRATARHLLDYTVNGGWRVRKNRTEFRALAEYVFLGSWQGMSVRTQLIQRALSTFGYKLVRVQSATDRPQFRLKRISGEPS